MALLKDYEYADKKGNYWRVLGVYLDWTYTMTNVKVGLYPTKEARFKDDASYIAVKSYAFSGLIEDKSIVYGELKQRPEFEGSKDI